MERTGGRQEYSRAKHDSLVTPDKIELDAMEKEKKTSFATLGRNSTGINITWHDDKNRKGGGSCDQQSRSGPGTPSKSRGFSPNMMKEEDMGSQLISVRMKLEERRKRIEEEKKKMELIMTKQREKVGQEAFLRAVARGIKKSGTVEGGEGGKCEILELASRVTGEKPGSGRTCRPFSLHLDTSPSTPSNSVSTPDIEANSISRMSDSLNELQSDIQRLAVQQSQIQTLMSSSPHPRQTLVSSSPHTRQTLMSSSPCPTKPDQQPFFISQPQPSPQQPFYISGPPAQYYGYHQPPNPVYEQHHLPPPHHPYIDQYGRQWGHNMTLQPSHHQPHPSHHQPHPSHHQPHPSHSQHYTSHHPQPPPNPSYSTPYSSHNQTYPPANPHPQNYSTPAYLPTSSSSYSTPPSFLPPEYLETDENQQLEIGSPFRRSLSRNNSLKRASELKQSMSINSAGQDSRNSSSFLETSDSNIDLDSTGSSSTELLAPRHVSPSPTPRISLVPKECQKPPKSEKPSLSTTFLEQRRKTLQANQNNKLTVTKDSPSNLEVSQPSSPCRSPTPSETLELTQSTIDTLNTMKTQELNKSSNAKGFVISFDTSTPVKPKPQLKPRRSSKKSDDLDSESVITDIQVTQEINEMSMVTEGDMSNNSVVTADDISISVVATPDSEEKTEAEDICCVCEMRVGVTSVNGASLCEKCDSFFRDIWATVGDDVSCVSGLNNCDFISLDCDSWCRRCWGDRANKVQLGVGDREMVEKKKDWVVMMTMKRKQQAEESRIKREEEGRKRREEEESKKEENLRKKEDDKKRREEIFEAYKQKKEAEKAKDEGRNFFSAKVGPKLRPKSAGGSRPRPNTIHVDHKEDLGINMGRMRGSQSNIAVSSGGMRTVGRVAGYRRGSNVSLQDESDGGVWGGSLRGLGHIGRSKSNSASNLGPGSLPLGIRQRGGRDFDDNASDVSSTTSGYRSGRGSAKLFREPVSKSNRPIIMNAVEYVVFPGVVNKDTRMRVLEEIERCECSHFLILFRDSKLQFRALYAYYPDTDEVFKIYGVGPKQVGDSMMDSYYKYNSGGKKFMQIHTKHLTVTIDGFTIHNSLWLGKKTKLPDKKDMALVI